MLRSCSYINDTPAAESQRCETECVEAVRLAILAYVLQVRNKGSEGDNVESDHDDGKHQRQSELATQKAASILTKKIRNGLEKFLKKTEKANEKMAYNQNTIHTGPLDLSIDISDFNTRVANGEFDMQERSLCLEHLLWKKSTMFTGLAWKLRFLASCLRILRQSEGSDTGVNPASAITIRRWKSSALLVNAIVSGLWGKWGCKAALVYEALAGMDIFPSL
jgi:hypothetical protein